MIWDAAEKEHARLATFVSRACEACHFPSMKPNASEGGAVMDDYEARRKQDEVQFAAEMAAADKALEEAVAVPFDHHCISTPCTKDSPHDHRVKTFVSRDMHMKNYRSDYIIAFPFEPTSSDRRIFRSDSSGSD